MSDEEYSKRKNTYRAFKQQKIEEKKISWFPSFSNNNDEDDNEEEEGDDDDNGDDNMDIL